MKFSKLLRSAKYWIYMLMVGLIFIFCGNKCSKTDAGSDLNPTEHFIKERVITDKVSTEQIEGVEYLVYHGVSYELPKDKTIPMNESFQDYENVGQKKIVTDIFFDEDSQDFVLREDITTRSYQIEKLKKKMSRHASWSYVGSLILWATGGFIAFIAFCFFLFWLDDFREFRRRNRQYT